MRTGRNVLQVLVALLGWLGFAAAWFYVFHSGSVGPRAWLDVFVIAFVAAAAVLSTLLWVRYNVNIYRRKGPAPRYHTSSSTSRLMPRASRSWQICRPCEPLDTSISR